jgi:hypothetical protein
MQHVGAIERPVGKRHRKRAALMQRNPVIEPDPLARNFGGVDVFTGQIYPSDPQGYRV